MKTLMTLFVAGGALIGVQAVTAQPAEAFGWGCGWGGGCCRTVAYYRPACGCHYYRVVRYRARRCCW